MARYSTKSSEQSRLDAAAQSQTQDPQKKKEKKTTLITVIASAVLSLIMAGGVIMVNNHFENTVDQLSAPAQEFINSANDYKTKTENLPESSAVIEGVKAATEAANKVTNTQNLLAVETHKLADGKAKAQVVTTTARSQILSLFDDGIDPQELVGWYWLNEDASAPLGLGVPETFVSGYKWRTTIGQSVNSSNTVDVYWFGEEARPAQGTNPRVLAWAKAEWNIEQSKFSNLKHGVTPLGNELGLKVA